MLRTLRLSIGAVVVLVSSTVLAAPPTTPSNDYFPLNTKTKWVYKIGDQTIEVVVVGPEKAGEPGVKVDTLVNSKVVASEVYQVKADGIYRLKVKDDKIEPPVKMLVLPPKKDATWKVDCKVGPSQTPVKGEFKIKDDKGTVTVPLGEFKDTILVEGIDLDIAGTKTTVRQWFVKDKGLVKVEYEISGTKTVLELKEFVRGE
jgi:hypothetical protein